MFKKEIKGKTQKELDDKFREAIIDLQPTLFEENLMYLLKSYVDQKFEILKLELSNKKKYLDTGPL